MPTVVYYVATSLDGYIATSDGGVEWLEPFQTSSEDYGYGDFISSVRGVVMGRRTYEQVLTFGDWPYPAKPCRVVTSRPLENAAPGVVAAASPREAMADLSGRVWLVGGAELAEAFRGEGLIHEYAVSIIPVLLGDGVPLFRPGRGTPLRLIDCRQYSSGVVQLWYAVGLADPSAATVARDAGTP